MILLIAAAAIGAIQAEAPTHQYWRLDRISHGCSIQASYGDGDTLMLNYERDAPEVMLWLASDRLKTTVEGDKYRVSLAILTDDDVDQSWSDMKFFGLTSAGGRPAIFGLLRPLFLNDIAKGKMLEVMKDGSTVAIHPITGISDAVGKLKDCAALIPRPPVRAPSVRHRARSR